MIENRSGLIVDAMLTTADGTAEADASLLIAASMRQKRPRGLILRVASLLSQWFVI
jgi:hypothetical protein